MNKLLVSYGLAIMLTASGCTSTGGQKFDATQVDQIKIGTTSTGQTLVALGEPLMRNVDRDGTERWQYSFTKGKYSPTGMGFVPYLGSFAKEAAKANISTQTLDLEFTGDVLTACTLKTVEDNTTQGGLLNGSTNTQRSAQEVACGE